MLDFVNLLPLIACALLGFGIVCFVVPGILKLCRAYPCLIREQDWHHTHNAPVPRLGGLALLCGVVGLEFFITLFLNRHQSRIPGHWIVVLSSVAMFALGFWDDLRPIGAKRKFLGQVLIAAAVHYLGIGVEALHVPFTDRIIPLDGWGVVCTVLWLVGITNLINLIDGVDGLAGGISLMLMALLAYVGYQSGTFVFLSAGMTGALLAFLRFNFPPARIYLGDGGAYLLGFQIGILSLVSSHKGSIVPTLIAPLFVLALPIVDTSLAILRRGLRGLPLFRPDRHHIHHHLLSSGMSRRRVVLSLYSITLVFSLLGFAAVWSHGAWLPVLAGVCVLVVVLCAGKLGFGRGWFSLGRTLGHSLSMRPEVQYALSLTRWLTLESERCSTIDDLYGDLVFVAGRLGFTSVRLTLSDGERCWKHPARACGSRSFREEVLGGLCGVLQFEVAICSHPRCALARSKAACACISDERLAEIMVELLVEAWAKAANRWRSGAASLRFGSPVPSVLGRSVRSGPRLRGLRLEPQNAPSSLPPINERQPESASQALNNDAKKH